MGGGKDEKGKTGTQLAESLRTFCSDKRSRFENRRNQRKGGWKDGGVGVFREATEREGRIVLANP